MDGEANGSTGTGDWKDRPPESGWRELPRDPQDAVTLDNDVFGARLWGPASQPTLSLGKSDLWDRRWMGERQPPVPLARIRELAMADGLDEIARSPNDTVYSAAYRYDFPCPKPGAQLILGLPFAEEAQIAPAAGYGWWLRAEGQGKRLEARIWVPLTRVLVVTELLAPALAAEDLWVRVYRHTDTILPGQPVNPAIGGGPPPGDFEPMAPPRCCDPGAAQSGGAASGAGDAFGIAQDFPAEGTFPQGFRAAAMAAALGGGVEVERRDGEAGLGTALWAPEEGRLSHGVVKRYRPINEARGAAATARFTQADVPTAIAATVQTTQDGEVPEAVARQVLAESLELGLEALHREQEAALEKARRPHRAQARVSACWPGPGDERHPGEGQHAAGGPATAVEQPAGDADRAEESRPADTVLEAKPLVVPSLRQPGGYYGDVPLCSVGSTKLWFQDAALWHNDFHLNEIRAEPALTLGRFEEVRVYADMIHTLLPQARENARDAYGLPGAMYPLVHFPLRCRGVARANITWELDLGLNGLVAKPLWLYYRYTGDRTFLEDVAYPVIAEGARFCAAYLSEGGDGCLHIEPTVSPEHWGLTPNFERNRDSASALTLTRYLLRAAARAARILERDGEEAASWEAKASRLAPYPTWESTAGPVWVDVAGAPPIEYNIPVPLSPLFWGDDVGLDSDAQVLDLARRTLEQIQVWEPHRGYLDRCVRPRLGLCAADAPIGPENLLQSYQSIRIFPAVPAHAEVEMEDLRAEGGFRVSASRHDGQIAEVRLHSELGEACRLAHPWPGCGAEVRVEPGATVVGGVAPGESHVAFPTEVGRVYAVRPVKDP